MKKKKYFILIIPFILIIIIFFWSAYLKEYITYYEAIKGRNILKCENYLKEYPKGKYYKEVLDHLDDLRFEELNEKNNKSNCIKYLTYIETFGENGKHIDTVNKLYEECMFNQAVKSKDIDILNDFLKEFPNSNYKEEILEIKNNIWSNIISNYETKSEINNGKREAIRFFKNLLFHYSKTNNRKIYIYYEKDIELKDWNEYSKEARDLWDKFVTYIKNERRSLYFPTISEVIKPSKAPPESLKKYYNIGNQGILEGIVNKEIQKNLDNMFGEKFFELIPSQEQKSDTPIFVIKYKIRNLEKQYGNIIVPMLYQYYESSSFEIYDKFICHILGICIDFTFKAYLPNNITYSFSQKVNPENEIKNIKGGIDEGYSKMTMTIFENFANKISENFGFK